MNRQYFLNHITQNPEVAVLIIGGGINGVGTFRDTAASAIWRMANFGWYARQWRNAIG